MLLDVPHALERLPQDVQPAREDTTLMERHALVINILLFHPMKLLLIHIVKNGQEYKNKCFHIVIHYPKEERQLIYYHQITTLKLHSDFVLPRITNITNWLLKNYPDA